MDSGARARRIAEAQIKTGASLKRISAVLGIKPARIDKLRAAPAKVFSPEDERVYEHEGNANVLEHLADVLEGVLVVADAVPAGEIDPQRPAFGVLIDMSTRLGAWYGIAPDEIASLTVGETRDALVSDADVAWMLCAIDGRITEVLDAIGEQDPDAEADPEAPTLREDVERLAVMRGVAPHDLFVLNVNDMTSDELEALGWQMGEEVTVDGEAVDTAEGARQDPPATPESNAPATPDPAAEPPAQDARKSTKKPDKASETTKKE